MTSPFWTRRDFLRMLALSASGITLAACQSTVALLSVTANSVATPTITPTATPDFLTSRAVPITSTQDFFSLSYGNDPFKIPNDWKLTITGLVDQPLALALDDLKAMPAVIEMRTLACISNPVGGDLMANAVWKGVRLKDLLARAGVQPSAQHIKLQAFDGFDTGIPLDLGQHENSLLVYEMNGEPLPIEHGAPLRCLWAGRFGMKQPKWIQTITLVDSLYRGFWEKQRWSHDAFLLPTSRIDAPLDNAIVTTSTITLSGIAFSGEDGIAQIEIVWDDRNDWQMTKLTRGPSPLAWTTWEWTGPAPMPGKHKVSVRVTTNAGTAQTRSDKPTMFGDTFPNGSNKIHSIVLEFRG